MIAVIVYFALYIPFYLGISGGYLGLVNNGWLGFNIFMNIIFLSKLFLLDIDVELYIATYTP